MHGRAVVSVARINERVYSFVGREMLQGGIAALAHPIFTAAETLQLIRDILAQQLATSPGPRQVHLPPRVVFMTIFKVCRPNYRMPLAITYSCVSMHCMAEPSADAHLGDAVGVPQLQRLTYRL